jgi:hypothetical protein
MISQFLNSAATTGQLAGRIGAVAPLDFPGLGVEDSTRSEPRAVPNWSRAMDHAHKLDIQLTRHIDVSEALHYLIKQLGCDNWYAACHHEHLFVFRLTKGTVDKFAVRVECTAPVEKGVYHGSKAWSLSISPLHDQVDLEAGQARALQQGLAEIE